MPYSNNATKIKYRKQYYLNNSYKWKQYKRTARTNLRKIVLDAKDKPCTDCHKTYPSYVMDFDHVRGKKRFDICRAYHTSLSGPNVLIDEINKCEVVCSNCHRIRTHLRKANRRQKD